MEEKSNAEGDTKATILKNSLIKMFSRESGDNETTSTNKEGIEEQCPESAGDGLKREESLEEKVDEVSRVTNLKKRLSFKAIKSRFTKEKKEEEVAPPEGENEGTGEKVEVEEEVKSGEDERKEDTKAEALRDDTGMGPPAEAPPAVPGESVAEGENVKTENGQTSESSPEEVGTLAKSDLETSNDTTGVDAEGAA